MAKKNILICIVSALSALATASAHAHLYFLNPGPSQVQIFPPGTTSPSGIAGRTAVIRVQSGGPDETNCTTRVIATLSLSGGDAVSIAGTGIISYDRPGTEFADITINAVKNGTATVNVSWEITASTSPSCTGGNTASFDFLVQDGVFKLTSAAVDTKSIGDPVSLASGELHDADTLVPDLSLGGPLPLSFGRYYAAFLESTGVGQALGNNWTHNFDVSAAQSQTMVGEQMAITLFGGKVITFLRNGASWDPLSTEQLDHQLQDVAGGGVRFLDLSVTNIYTFDAGGRLIRIEDRSGNTLEVTQGTDGPTTVVDGLGRSLTFSYTSGRLTQVQDQSNRTVQFSYTGNNLTTVTDTRSNAVTYAYTSEGGLEGLLLSTTRPDGSVVTTQTFDTDGRVATQADGEANTSTFQFDQNPNTEGTNYTDALGRTSSYVHPAGQNLSASTDTAGNADAYTYDANNRLLSYSNRTGAQATFTYHAPSGFVASVTDFSGATTSMTYETQTQDGFRYFVNNTLTYPDGTTESHTFDANGSRTSFADRRGNTSTFTYMANGQLLTTANQLNATTQTTINADGTVATATSAAGVTNAFAYDSTKRLQSITYADGGQKTLQYDSGDNLTNIIDPLGRSIQISYDSNGRVATLTDPAGNTRTLSYDNNGRVTDLVDRLGLTHSVQYDAAGNVTEVRNGAAEAVLFEYEGRNQVSTISDSIGTAVHYGYDANENLTSITNGLGNVGTLTYDTANRLASITAPGGQTTNYTYDNLGRLTSTLNADGRTRAFAYNDEDELTQITANGLVAQFTRNAIGLPATITDPNGSSWLRQYDASGRLTQSTDPLGRDIGYSYDNRGRRNAITNPLGTTQRAFDLANNLTQIQFFDGTSSAFSYDANNKMLTSAGVNLGRDALSRITESNGLLISYDNAGRINQITYAAGKVVSYAYDARGRLTGVTDWTGGTTQFSYDSANRRTGIQRPNGVNSEFTYDANDRIVGISHRTSEVLAEWTGQRDAGGRITSADITAPLLFQPSGGSRTKSYDAAHQISGATYDALGRLTGDGVHQYTWDGNSTLTGYQNAGTNVTFGYDGLGQRISRSSGTETISYTLNYAHSLPTVAVTQLNGTDESYYVYEPDGRLLHRIAALDNGLSFYQFDHVGSTVMLTDAAGAVTDAYAVSPFGEQTQHQGSSEQPFIFQGAFGVMAEPGNRLFNMRRRYYDAESGRFLSPDPIAQSDPLAINPYQFAYNQPLRFADPSGLTASTVERGSTGPSAGSLYPRSGQSIDGAGFAARSPYGNSWGARYGSGTYGNYSSYYRRYYDRYGGYGYYGGGYGGYYGGGYGGYYDGGYGGAYGDGFGAKVRRAFTYWADRVEDDTQTGLMGRDQQEKNDYMRGFNTPKSKGGLGWAAEETTPPPATKPSAQPILEKPDWSNFGNDIGGGNSVIGPSPADSPTDFFFFSPDNTEILVETLNGDRASSQQHFWVFYGGLQEVEYTLTVTDTETGQIKTYPGQQRPRGSEPIRQTPFLGRLRR